MKFTSNLGWENGVFFLRMKAIHIQCKGILVWENNGFVKGWRPFLRSPQVIWFGKIRALLRTGGHSRVVHK